MSNSNYYEGVNQGLLELLPPGPTRVIELGCANGRLGEVYKQQNPESHWTGVDFVSSAIRSAIPRLDEVVHMNMNHPEKDNLAINTYDTVVCGDILEHLNNPVNCLRFLNEISAQHAQLFACVPNMTHISVFERMLMGDLTYEPSGLLDDTHVRMMSIPSTFKMFLDGGWLPTMLAFNYGASPHHEWMIEEIFKMTDRLGIARSTASRNLLTFQKFISAVKSPVFSPASAPLTVVVPVTNQAQFDLNIMRSPGLTEINAEIIPLPNMSSAAEALEEGRRLASNPWILFCHQDVYIPRNSGYALSHLINTRQDPRKTLIGFAGIANKESRGMVIDRLNRLATVRSDSPTSMDEFAVLIAKDSIHKIDPSLGWHLWATDLCIQSNRKSGIASIETVPLFHNSLTEDGQTEVFGDSLKVMTEKYTGYGDLVTLTGTYHL